MLLLVHRDSVALLLLLLEALLQQQQPLLLHGVGLAGAQLLPDPCCFCCTP
jgi:hypothetical protein